MSYNNFIPEVWSRTILTERDAVTVAYNNSWKQFEGDIKAQASKVKIAGIGGATVTDYYKFGDDRHTDLNLEVLSDQSTMLEITEAKSISFVIDDIDKLQANANIMQPTMKKTASNMAVTMDKFIYSKIFEAGLNVTKTNVTSLNIFSALSEGIAKIMKDGSVFDLTELTLELDPWIFQKIILGDINFGRLNDNTIKNGYRGNVLGVKTFVTNNFPVKADEDGSHYYGFLRTNQAIAVAEQLNKMTAGDVGVKGFGEYVKGLHLYGAKMIKPKEACLFDFTLAEETQI
jgi:hypothetical protein